jgi:hypothetical protein
MIHTAGVYYSIASATSAYQGKVLAFIGDLRATKEPTSICLLTLKLWEWHMSNAVTNFDKFNDFYAVEANKGTLWTPVASDRAPAKFKVPNLVAIPNVLVDLLCTQGLAVTPQNVLASINDFVQGSGQPGHHWAYIQKWCLVVGQANANGKSKVFLDTSPVTIDDEDFDRWDGNRLNITLGPHPLASVAPSPGTTGNQQAMDHLALSKMLATTIGSNMMQFSQAITPTRGGHWSHGRQNNPCHQKRVDQDQIAKHKDACGVHSVQQILAIWLVI